jgi:putative hydroxymethylpyrimidine transport system substrate-binding protein
VKADNGRIAKVACVALAVLAAACEGSSPSSVGSESASSAQTAHLVVELDWTPNPDHVGLYYAQDKGYFSDVGVTAEFRAPSNAADPVKLVALNKVDLGVSYEPELFYAQQNDLPVTVVAALVPVPLNSLIVSPDVGVTQLSDMSGKSIGVSGISSDDAFFSTMLKTAGLSEGDVEKVSVGFTLLPSLLALKVDGIIGGYRNVEAIQFAQETGRAPVVFPADQLGVPTYAELVIVANAERLATDAAYADEVSRFLAALVKGTDGAISDPSGATSLMKRVTQYDSTFLDQSVPSTLTLLKPVGGLKTGCLDPGAWTAYGAWLRSNDLIDSPANASVLQTNAYLPHDC